MADDEKHSVTIPELPRETVAEPDPVADARRREAHARSQGAHYTHIALVAMQWVAAFGAGFWAVYVCAPVDSALPFLAGMGLVGALIAGQSAALALAWIWLIFELPRLIRWLKAPPGTPLRETGRDELFTRIAGIVAVTICLIATTIMAIVLAVLLPDCSAFLLWLRLLGAAALVSIPTPKLLREG